MFSLLLIILVSYLIYKESDFYLYFISDIVRLDLEEDYLIDSIFIKKNSKMYYNIKVDKEVQCNKLTEEKGIQCNLINELDDLVVL